MTSEPINARRLPQHDSQPFDDPYFARPDRDVAVVLPTIEALSAIFSLHQALPPDILRQFSKRLLVIGYTSIDDAGKSVWTASMFLYASDVGHLIVHGFKWSTEDIVPNYTDAVSYRKWHVPHRESRSFRFVHLRRYIMEGTFGSIRWTGCLLVSFRKDEMESFLRFTPDDVTADKFHTWRSVSTSVIIKPTPLAAE